MPQTTTNNAQDFELLSRSCSNAYRAQTKSDEATLVGEPNYIIDHIIYEQKKSKEKSILRRSRKRQDNAPGALREVTCLFIHVKKNMAMNMAPDLGSILLPLIHVASHPAPGNMRHNGNARRIIFNNVLSALRLDAGAAS